MNPELNSPDKARYVQNIFERIAPRYDLMNRLMTGGQDIAWRNEVIQRARLQPSATLLDLGAGTGDIAREAMRRHPDCQVTAADFTLGMMLAGKQREPLQPAWATADALRLPFPDQSFDAVVSGFLLRNVTDIAQALREQYRVLKPGGHFVSLDTTRPVQSILTPFIRIHMRFVIPFLGTLITGQRDAYTYLPSSSEAFLSAEDLQAQCQAAGFTHTGFHRRMFGTIAIHWGEKPA